MAVSFEGFPQVLERSALRPGRWFVAAEGLRPILCLATEVMDPKNPVALTFGSPRVEQVEVESELIAVLPGPFATVADEVVFTPGLGDHRPQLIAPTRRSLRNGCLLRLKSGDLGIAFTLKAGGELMIVSLSTGERAEAFDLVFDRWSLGLRRGATERLIGYFKPLSPFAEERRRV